MNAHRLAGTLKLRHEQPRVTVEREVFGVMFDVIVTPTQSTGHDREFRTHREAIAYARHLAHSMGWTLIDHCAEGAASGGSR